MEALAMIVEVACVGCLAAGLGVAAASDLASRIVPNGCVAAVALAGASRAALRGSLAGAAAGVVCVAAVMLAASRVSSRLRGEPGVGGGDVKLLSAVGAWTGPVLGLAVVGASCLLGVMGWAIAWLRAARRPEARPDGIPLAPAIALAALAAVLCPPAVAP